MTIEFRNYRPSPEEAAAVVDELEQIVRRSAQRSRQQAGRGVELEHPVPLHLSPSRLLDVMSRYLGASRTHLWRMGLEALTELPYDRTFGRDRPSVQFLAAKQAWSRMTPDSRDIVRRSISDAQLAAGWERHRIAYLVHPGLAQALSDTDPAELVASEILRRLPHPDPAFLFPTGIPVTISDGQPGTIRLFLVRGAVDQMHASTVNPLAAGLQICVLTQVGPIEAPPVDWDLSAVRLSIGGDRTIEQVAADAARSWDAAESVDPAALPEWTRTILRVCLPVLLYCCSAGPDARATPSPPAARKAKARRSSDRDRITPVTIQLGYRVGPALTAARARSESERGAETGRTLRTHVRRAHWHTFRVGPGRSESVLRWVAPTVINPGGPITTTVIPVAGPRGGTPRERR